MRIMVPLVLLAAACGARQTPPPAMPQEPRDLDATIDEQIQRDAAKTPDDDACTADSFTVYLEAGTTEQATYIAAGCGFTYRYFVGCERPTDDDNHPSSLWRCTIEKSEEVDAAEVEPVMAEAKENDLDDVTA